MSRHIDLSRGWRRRGKLLLAVLVGPPALFLLLAPLLALLGHLTGLFAPQRIGHIAGLVLLGGVVILAFLGAVAAVVAAALAGIGAVAAAVVNVVSHVLSRLAR